MSDRTVDEILDDKLDRKIQSSNQTMMNTLARNTQDTSEIKKDLQGFIEKEGKANEDKMKADFKRDLEISKIQDITRQTLEQAQKTNGAVARHEEKLSRIVPEVESLVKDREAMLKSRKRLLNTWIERALWAAAILAVSILKATGILHL